MNTNFKSMTCRLLMVAVLGVTLPVQQAYAGIVSTERVASSAQVQNERSRIQKFLEREDVRKEMLAQGVDLNTAQERVNALTDEEVQKVAGKIDTMAAGGDVLGLIFVVFVILLITDVLGLTKVFPFTRSSR